MPVSHIFGGTPGSDLLDLLLQALSMPALRMPAAECLRVLAARKVSDVGYGRRVGCGCGCGCGCVEMVLICVTCTYVCGSYYGDLAVVLSLIT